MNIDVTKDELKLIVKFLRDYSSNLGHAGCNDLRLGNTPSNRKITKEAVKSQCGENWDSPPEKDKYFYTIDFVIVDHLAEKLEKEI